MRFSVAAAVTKGKLSQLQIESKPSETSTPPKFNGARILEIVSFELYTADRDKYVT